MTLFDGIRRGVPIAIVVLAEGIAFGALARVAGLAPAPVIAMSALAYSGSAQLVALSVVTAGGGIGAATLAAGLANLRALPMGASVARLLGGRAPARVARAQLVTDESWALAQIEPGRWDRALLAGATVALWTAWVTGTAAGALGAARLGDPRALGLDAAFPALFLALLVPLARSRRAVIVAVGGAAVALGLTPLLPPGLPLLGAAAVPFLVARSHA
jgi:predicted branched-subunit amino acid permease